MVVSVQEVAAMKRTMRRPQFPFQLRYRPWQIQPCMIAPVLPGETLKKLQLQARVVTDPINNKLTGWWTEFYFFYVKMTDLYDRDIITSMFLDPETDVSSLDSATKIQHYHYNGDSGKDINWVNLCLERIVDEYFRYEGETNASYNIDGLPAAQVNVTNWSESLGTKADIIDDGDENLVSTTPGQGDGTTAVMTSEIVEALRRYNLVQEMGLTDLTFEEYCATYGVNIPAQDKNKPELIRYIKEWSYPTNTINPADGAAASAVSWVVSGQANKRRFFKEPGFIVGVCVTRPKVFFRNQRGNAVSIMNSMRNWLPPQLWGDANSSLTPLTSTIDSIGEWSAAAQMDVKDLFIYGDQFINFSLASTDANLVDLPALDASNHRYADLDDAKALFVDSDDSDGLTMVRSDGIVSLAVATRLTDTSINSIGTNITV